MPSDQLLGKPGRHPMLEVEVQKTSAGGIQSVRVTLGASLALVLVLASHITGSVGVQLVKTLLALLR